jgi:hypothetical protein
MFQISPSTSAHFSSDILSRSVPVFPSPFSKFDFGAISPAGYHVAVGTSFTLPAERRTQMPLGWIEEYDRDGLVLCDPSVKWAFANRGRVRLGELCDGDKAGFLARAARFGLRFGAVVSHSEPDEAACISWGQFFRGDRDFTESEIGSLFSMVKRLHGLAVGLGARFRQTSRRTRGPSDARLAGM